MWLRPVPAAFRERRQVVDDGLVALQAAQEEGGGDAAEAVGHVAVALALYGGGKLVLEGFRGAEVALVGEVHDAPELGEAVLDGRVAHGDAQLSGDGAHGLALGGVGVLDVLGLVDDDGQPGELLQLGGIGAEDAVGGEEDVGGGGGRTADRDRNRRSGDRDGGGEGLQRALGAVVGEDGERGGETGDFGLPVGDSKISQRCDHRQ